MSTKFEYKSISKKLRGYTNILIIITFVLLINSINKNIKRAKSVNPAVREAQKELEKAQKENSELLEQKEKYSSDFYTEVQLRNKLGYAKPDEVVLVLPSDEELKKLVPPLEEEEAILPKANWQKWLDVFEINL